jgi:hypothetical protein
VRAGRIGFKLFASYPGSCIAPLSFRVAGNRDSSSANCEPSASGSQTVQAVSYWKVAAGIPSAHSQSRSCVAGTWRVCRAQSSDESAVRIHSRVPAIWFAPRLRNLGLRFVSSPTAVDHHHSPPSVCQGDRLGFRQHGSVIWKSCRTSKEEVGRGQFPAHRNPLSR